MLNRRNCELNRLVQELIKRVRSNKVIVWSCFFVDGFGTRLPFVGFDQLVVKRAQKLPSTRVYQKFFNPRIHRMIVVPD